MANHKVGGEVDAFCTRCKMLLAHTILAMVGTKVARVRCNTCNGDHAFRNEPGKSGTTAKKTKAAPKESKTVVSWQERVAEKSLASAKKYNFRETFLVEDLIDHPTFGIGIVAAVRADKIDVAFKGDQKTLMHGKAEGISTEKPKFARPGAFTGGAADKPVQEEPAGAPAAASEPAPS